jgi:hypothetical protein
MRVSATVWAAAVWACTAGCEPGQTNSWQGLVLGDPRDPQESRQHVRHEQGSAPDKGRQGRAQEARLLTRRVSGGFWRCLLHGLLGSGHLNGIRGGCRCRCTCGCSDQQPRAQPAPPCHSSQVNTHCCRSPSWAHMPHPHAPHQGCSTRDRVATRRASQGTNRAGPEHPAHEQSWTRTHTESGLTAMASAISCRIPSSSPRPYTSVPATSTTKPAA